MDRLFDNDWVLRGLALVLAVFLWVQATLTFITFGSDTVRNVPLQVLGASAGVTLTSAVRDVQVTVLAPSTLTRLGPQDFQATVMPDAARAGSQQVAVVVAVPRGTRLKTVSPDVVTVRVVRTTGPVTRAARRRK